MEEKNKKSEAELQKGIWNWVIKIFILAVDFYIVFVAESEWVDQLFFGIWWLKPLVLVAVQFFLFDVFVELVYKYRKKLTENKWKKENLENWYDGTWLHIHEKENVRVGIVNIHQEYNNLEISAENYNINSKNNVGVTTWHYIGAEFPSAENGNKLVGCYTALREGRTKKYGLHTLDKINSKNGKMPVFLKGSFGDALEIKDAKGVRVSDKTAILYMFRITEENQETFAEYLNDHSKMADILKNPKVADTDFVKKLKKVEKRSKFRSQHSKVNKELEQLNKQPITGITEEMLEKMLKQITCKVVICDRHEAPEEIQYINDSLGLDWSEDEVENIFDRIEKNPEKFDQKLMEFRDALSKYEKLYDEFKTLMRKICEGVVEADGIHRKEEKEFVDRLNAFFNQNSSQP